MIADEICAAFSLGQKKAKKSWEKYTLRWALRGGFFELEAPMEAIRARALETENRVRTLDPDNHLDIPPAHGSQTRSARRVHLVHHAAPPVSDAGTTASGRRR